MSHEAEVEEVEIEEHGRKGGTDRLPNARRYVIRVDKPTYTVSVSHMLGREILALAGKVPVEQWKLTQKFHGGGAKTIGLDDDVDFRAPGVERFMTLKRDQTEGDMDTKVRREFKLPARDVVYLDSIGLPWEAIVCGKERWLLIHRWPVPSGYTCSTTTVALLIASGYPDTQIDMAYFNPALTRVDNLAIGALRTKIVDGASFQRWSRHRTRENPWRAGEDDVSTHLVLVVDWLERELAK